MRLIYLRVDTNQVSHFRPIAEDLTKNTLSMVIELHGINSTEHSHCIPSLLTNSFTHHLGKPPDTILIVGGFSGEQS